MPTSVHIPAEKELKSGNSVLAALQNMQTTDEAKLALDIFETEEELVLLVPMAGVEVSEIEILLTEDVLSISGVRHFPKDLFGDEPAPFLEECYWGKFSRSVVLPAAVNSEDITAKMRNGVLIIVIPKAKKAKSKRVAIELIS